MGEREKKKRVATMSSFRQAGMWALFVVLDQIALVPACWWTCSSNLLIYLIRYRYIGSGPQGNLHKLLSFKTSSSEFYINIYIYFFCVYRYFYFLNAFIFCHFSSFFFIHSFFLILKLQVLKWIWIMWL